MAWSKVVATRNSDLPRESSSICSLSTLIGDDDKQQQSMDDLLKNMYNEHEHHEHHTQPNASPPAAQVGRTVEEVWKEIVAGGGGGGGDREEEAQAQVQAQAQAQAQAEAVVVAVEGGEEGGDQVRAAAGEAGGGGGLEEMTLEDFLTRAGAVREEDVGVAGAGAGAGVPIGYGQFQVQQPSPQGHVVYGNGGTSTTISGGGGGRVGKRRAVQEAPLDKATQQKQRRMIKNRESAARSRERKQAYTIELESIVTRLEGENALLLREEAELKKRRFKRLMENLIPIVQKRRPPRVLRRVHSVHW